MNLPHSVSPERGNTAASRASSHRSHASRLCSRASIAALLLPLGCGGYGAEPIELDVAQAALVAVQQSGEYTLTITNNDPELSDKIITNLANTFFQVYPQLRERFNPGAPLDVSFIFTPGHPFPASALPVEITFDSKHFIRNPQDWDVVTHEAMHLVQYPSLGPSWIIEGISDYVRNEYGVNNAAAGWVREDKPNRYYNEGYGHTALFLTSIEQAHAPGLVDDVTSALLSGSYTEDLWSTLTGSSLDQLWNEYRPSFPLPADAVTLFFESDYGGDANADGVIDAVTLGPGNYAVADLLAAGARNDDLSSLWVPEGLEVQLFSDGDFSGEARTFIRNVPSLFGEGADDTVSSLIVSRR